MDHHFPSAIVTGYESLIERLDLPDPQDRPVLAAAVRGGADVIVTQNLRDFPAERLALQHYYRYDDWLDHARDA